MIQKPSNSSKQFNEAFSYAVKNNKTFLLDGSMGSYMHRQCNVPRHPILWMLPALLQEKYHSAVVQAHKNYMAAGSDIIETFNFTCVPLYLKKGNCQDKIKELNLTAATLARRAITEFQEEQKEQESKRKIWLAGILPTPGESYFHCHQISDEEFDTTFRAIVQSIDKFSDFFIAQTINSSRDACLIAKAANQYAPEKLLFMAFTVNSKRQLNSGETLTKAIEYLEEQKIDIAGYGVNCCSLLSVNQCLKEIRKCTKKPTLAYPNFFEDWQEYKATESEGKTRQLLDLQDEAYQKEMKTILEDGKDVVIMGGCCGVHPQKISLLRDIIPRFEN